MGVLRDAGGGAAVRDGDGAARVGPARAGELGSARQAGRARVAERGCDIDDDDEDEVGVLRDAGGGAAAPNEAAAAVAKSLSSISVVPIF